MIIQPKVRGFICTAAHPKGCFESVQRQVDYVSKKGALLGPKNVLIIGASTGYGLATRIAAAFGANANTVAVLLERPAEGKRTASPGWYNTAAFEQLAQKAGHPTKSINGDAFANATKEETLAYIKEHMGPIDLLVYSVAAPKRQDPKTGESFQSVLKPVNHRYTSKTVDPMTGVVKEITLEPANESEITATEYVMGGEDWAIWVDQLLEANLLAPNVMTMAYSYIGPELTHPIYKDGTIGYAKRHLHKTAEQLNQHLSAIGGRAFISINKALVTQASSAIPVVPLYVSMLYKLMKEQGTHEGCIEQIDRLFREKLYTDQGLILDKAGYLRLDDWEMNLDIQDQICALWPDIKTENLEKMADIHGYREDFYRLFGFNWPDIDYEIDVDPDVNIPSLRLS